MAVPHLANILLAFLDVLGTKDTVPEAQDEELMRILGARESVANILEEDRPNRTVVSFTDSTVVSWPVGDDDGNEVLPSLAWVPDDIAAFQLSYSLQGRFLRGGVSQGAGVVTEGLGDC